MFPTAPILQHYVVRRKRNFLATTNSFAKRLLDARLSYSVRQGRQVGQTELAHKLGAKPQSWSGWESGRTEPSLDTVRRIAELLHVDPGWLAFGEWHVQNKV